MSSRTGLTYLYDVTLFRGHPMSPWSYWVNVLAPFFITVPQISPHFLFNTLSMLSSLVSEDPKKAERFIEELASGYRYLLQTNEQPLPTLENEVRFIEAYFHLLQTRFGAGIGLEVDIDERYYAFLLPPLTRQLLVENAVKHNSVLPEKSLVIRIFSGIRACPLAAGD